MGFAFRDEIASRAREPAAPDPRAESVVLRPHPELAGALLFADSTADADWTIPLEHPEWVPAARAGFMRDDDPVVGFVHERRAYAIAWWILKNHHVANIEFEDVPVMVAFCEMCSSAVGFDPRVAGRRLTFELVGLFNGSILIADRATGTLWAPFSGEGLHGPLAGTWLSRRPLHQATWRDWRGLYPDTRVARGEPADREGHGVDGQPGRAGIAARFRRSLLRAVDRRMPPHDLIAGVALGGRHLAVPLAAFDRTGPVLQDTLGGRGVVLYRRPGTLMVSALLAERGGRPIRFGHDVGSGLIDLDTGARWDLAGARVEGPPGDSLSALPVNVEEWYIWAAYHPATRLRTATADPTPGPTFAR